MPDWAMSPEGQAVATWGSAALSLFAVLLALGVAIVEQRRANRELLRGAQRERERRRIFIDAALAIAGEAVPIMRRAFDKIAASLKPGADAVDQTHIACRLRDELQPMHDAALALQNAAPFDAPIALNVAHLCRAIERSWDETAAYERGLGGVLERQSMKVEAAERALRAERNRE